MKESYGMSWVKIRANVAQGIEVPREKVTKTGRNELSVLLQNYLTNLTELQSADFKRSFEEVVAQLSDSNKNKRRIASELLVLWIMHLLELRCSQWRTHHDRQGKEGEVNVLAVSDKIVYSHWQILFKHTKNAIDVDTLATQVGLTFLTNADVVMVVTTSSFTSDAVNYANQVTDTSRYYVILLDGDDIQQITADRARIIDILNAKARRVFARKEIGAVAPRADTAAPIRNTQAQVGTEIAMNAETLFDAESDEESNTTLQ
jgi:hypothetical protein